MEGTQVKDLYGKIVEIKLKDSSTAKGELVYYNFDNETITLNNATVTSREYTTFKEFMMINKNDWGTLSMAGPMINGGDR